MTEHEYAIANELCRSTWFKAFGRIDLGDFALLTLCVLFGWIMFAAIGIQKDIISVYASVVALLVLITITSLSFYARAWYQQVNIDYRITRGQFLSKAVSLPEVVALHLSFGAFDASDSLDYQLMPKGYALMLSKGGSGYYWLKFNGETGAKNENKFDAYHGALADFSKDEVQ